MQDLSEGVRGISSFFGFALTEAQVQQITERSSFRAMKENSANSHGSIGNTIFRKGDVFQPDIQPNTLLLFSGYTANIRYVYIVDVLSSLRL